MPESRLCPRCQRKPVKKPDAKYCPVCEKYVLYQLKSSGYLDPQPTYARRDADSQENTHETKQGHNNR